MKKLLHLSFLPTSVDLGLLVLRVGIGLCMAILHGWGKLTGFQEMRGGFPDPLHVGHQTSLILAIVGEFVCAILLALGLFTRWAALGALVTMSVAFFMAHGGRLTGDGNGEMAFIYLLPFVALFITGPGKFSVDAKMGGGGARKSSPPRDRDR